MQLFLVWMMMFTFHPGSTEDLVKPFKDVMPALEGDNVTLSCSYSGSVQNLCWYQHKSSSSPQLLITDYSEDTEGLSFTHDKNTKKFHLIISSAAVSDSAVYYCALRSNTGGQYKMIFGSGTRLTVEPKEVYKPSFYELSDGETTACLATGFSQLWAANNTHNDIFEKTSAVRIGDDSLFNEVALLSKDDKDKCQRAEAASELCEDTLEPDAKVNLMSLTILGLRLLFLKTIVFNVLLTLRLWISP